MTPPRSVRILVADDEESMRHFLDRGLRRAGYEVTTVGSGREALQRWDEAPGDLAVLDLRMPDGDGLATLAQLRSRTPDAPIVLMTAHGSVEAAVEAMHLGAADFLAKPFPIEELLLRVERALQVAATKREHGELRTLVAAPDAGVGMVTQSPAMAELRRQVDLLGASAATVLLTGESGVGKGLVAKALHLRSSRAGGPFVAMNCAAVPDTLFESELFGHEAGAFTGARAKKAGLLQRAHGGTLFLDEIGEMNPILQAKLLRVLQEKEFERVGGTKTLKADVRVIAATNRDLKEMSRTGSFRQDLYYRLNVISVRTPALRDRREDIPLLAAHFIQRFSDQTKRRVTGLAPPAKACLLKYDWPGNIRELQNAIERAVVMGSTDFIQVQDLPDSVWESAPAGGSSSGALHEQLNEAKREILIRAIAEADNNYTEAARRLDIHPNHLFRLVKTLDLTPKRKRAQA